MTTEAEDANRASYVGAPQQFDLNQACRVIVDAFGPCVYVVGSCLKKRDYRDVDVRCILDDEVFAALFPGIGSAYQYHPLWSLMCSSISLYLSQHSGLPIDFQFQRMTEANEKFPGERNAVGLFTAGGRERKDTP